MNLLKIEWHKIIGNRAFWILLGLHVVLLYPAAYGLEGILNSFKISVNGQAQVPISSLMGEFSIFNYPNVWHNIAYLATWFRFVLAVIVVILVANEFSYRTLRQNIIDGMSKVQVVLAKELVIALVSLIAAGMLVVLVLLLGDAVEGVSTWDGFQYAIAYFLGLMLYLNFTYLLTTLVKKAGFAIGLLLIYTFLIENIVGYFLPDNVAVCLPMHVVDGMVPNPAKTFMGEEVTAGLSAQNVTLAVVYIGLFVFLNILLLKRGHAAK